MSDDPQRVLLVNDPIDNMRGVTQRVKQESTIDNTRGVTRRVYVVGGGGGNIDELNVTPSTSAQTITASGGVDGYSPVNVAAVDASIDANITAGNIKDGVSILGVTGNYQGNTPTGTMYIISNGTYNVADKAIANVQVPTVVPQIYRVFRDNNGVLDTSITTPFLPLPNTITDISEYCLINAYRNTPSSALSGTIDLSSLTTISGASACRNMFYNCTGITSADLSSLTTASGAYACDSMFYSCTGITSIDLSSLTTVSGANACYSMFYRCTGITSVNLSSLTTVSGANGCNSMFAGCTGITSIDLSSLTTLSTNSAFGSMFSGCTGITSVDLSSLTTISGASACNSMFAGCTSLATLYIGGTTTIDFGGRTNVFSSMFYGCTQNIDVYAPAGNQAAIEAFSGYPNFGGTGTVTWHWRS